MCFPRSLCPFQLEESEFTSAAAVKARKSMEVEIEDLHVQMEDISKAKQAVSAALHPLGFMKQKFSPVSWCDATAGAVFLWNFMICFLIIAEGEEKADSLEMHIICGLEAFLKAAPSVVAAGETLVCQVIAFRQR